MTQFRVLISSDEEYEDLCAEIYYQDQFVAISSQEEGFENIRIDLYPPPDKNCWIFNFAEFEAILKSAKDRLWEMQRDDQS